MRKSETKNKNYEICESTNKKFLKIREILVIWDAYHDFKPFIKFKFLEIPHFLELRTLELVR